MLLDIAQAALVAALLGFVAYAACRALYPRRAHHGPGFEAEVATERPEDRTRRTPF